MQFTGRQIAGIRQDEISRVKTFNNFVLLLSYSKFCMIILPASDESVKYITPSGLKAPSQQVLKFSLPSASG